MIGARRPSSAYTVITSDPSFATSTSSTLTLFSSRGIYRINSSMDPLILIADRSVGTREEAVKTQPVSALLIASAFLPGLQLRFEEKAMDRFDAELVGSIQIGYEREILLLQAGGAIKGLRIESPLTSARNLPRSRSSCHRRSSS
jgi:hypothetical protein